ncbi:MAG: ComEC/Rec2 family competence protein [Propionibacteriales bacterium]|nr:ComEC/Rec2 family competence protein [Propionibacteriales bacterium]
MTREPLDLRLAPAAIAAWGMAAWGLGWSPAQAVVGAAVLLICGAALLSRGRGGSPAQLLAAACLVVGAGALAASGLRAGAVHAGPVPTLAEQRAEVDVVGTIVTDPVRREGKFAAYVIVRLNAAVVTGRGWSNLVRSPLLVIGDESWLAVHLGERVSGSGRLAPAQGSDLAAVLLGRPDPERLRRAGWVYRGISRVRSGLTEAASPLPPAQAALVPALVDGDDAEMPAQITADFKTTGLTHLLAVSGSNLTLVLGFVLFAARWCGVRARGLAIVGALAVIFFVLLARSEPSVLRAAAMGLVSLAGLSAGGRRRGTRALCVAAVALVMLDPWLARSVGFLLSTVATAGILLLAPGWRDAMARWLPRPLAEAVAVPLSAQLACTPVIAAISGQVSLVAVVSNLLVCARRRTHNRRRAARWSDGHRQPPAGSPHRSPGRRAGMVDRDRCRALRAAARCQHRLAGRTRRLGRADRAVPIGGCRDEAGAESAVRMPCGLRIDAGAGGSPARAPRLAARRLAAGGLRRRPRRRPRLERRQRRGSCGRHRPGP